MLGRRLTSKITCFFDDLGETKLRNFLDKNTKRLEEVEDFLMETYKPGLFKILAVLEDLKMVKSQFKVILEFENVFEANLMEDLEKNIIILSNHN